MVQNFGFKLITPALSKPATRVASMTGQWFAGPLQLLTATVRFKGFSGATILRSNSTGGPILLQLTPESPQNVDATEIPLNWFCENGIFVSGIMPGQSLTLSVLTT